MEDEDDGGGEEDGDQADTEAEDPVVADSDVEVEGGEQGAPHHHVKHLWEEEEEAPETLAGMLSVKGPVLHS